MNTVVGIFSTRERAEQALTLLLQKHIPEYRIVYLTGSESDARAVDKKVGEAAGPRQVETGSLSAGARSVYALGLGGSSSAASVGSSPFSALVSSASSEDTELFQRVLGDGHSVVIVRTKAPQSAASVCEIFDNYALHMKRTGSRETSASFRRIPGGVLAEFTGRIALGDGTSLLRESIQNFLAFGHSQVVLDLERVDYVDSAGLGELVRAYTTVRNHGGQIKFVKPSPGVLRLLQTTKLDQVLDIVADQSTAIRGLRVSA
jgi:anti-sigma B factor antagonist